ncbi:MAG TPA: four-carbon acid sugar kinase family protein [Chloroflexota bacterium]|nr:four-carbon acid sugar kinase family protein [Chloroflexota bacterium]
MSEPPERVEAADLFATLPAEWPSDPLPVIREERRARSETVVVLDDDPTGTQTMHGVPVLTRWTQDLLRRELAGEPAAIFLLTNSRGLPRPDAVVLNREIGHALGHGGTRERPALCRGQPRRLDLARPLPGRDRRARGGAGDAGRRHPPDPRFH